MAPHKLFMDKKAYKSRVLHALGLGSILAPNGGLKAVTNVAAQTVENGSKAMVNKTQDAVKAKTDIK
jgi:hypothetical protein